MRRKIIIGAVAIVILGAMVIRLASNKSKINQETSYRDVIQNVAVDIRTAQTTNRADEINFVGEFKPSKESYVSAEIPGKIASVLVNEGDLVTQGQVIAELDQSSLELKLEADEAQYEHSKEDLARYENLNKNQATTDVTLKQMRLTNKLNEIAVKNDEDQINKSKLKAPITGYLAVKNFEVGMVVVPGAIIGQIANTGILKFTAMLPEYQVVKFAMSQKVNVSADVFPGVKYSGAVSQISEKGDENHQYKIEVTVNNDNKQYPLKGGMNGTMTIDAKNALRGIFIPREALVGSTENPEIYLVQDNRAMLKKVTIGITTGDEIQITGGISDGDKIVTSGMNCLKDSATIKIAGIR